MRKRVSRERLFRLAAKISDLQGRPVDMWARAGNMAIGHLKLDHNSAYGGWDLVEITSKTGGESSLVDNNLGGRGRLTAFEMESFLLGMICALEGSQYWPSNLTSAQSLVQ